MDRTRLAACSFHDSNSTHRTTPKTTDNSLDGARAWFAEEGLSRRRDDRVIAGVSGAFARRFGVNPFVARVITVAGRDRASPRSRTWRCGC